MLTPEEIKIAEFGKANGKTTEEVLGAIAKYRQSKSVTTKETPKKDFLQRVISDIQTRGSNVVDEITNSNQNPLLSGIKATGQAFSAVGDVANETIQSVPSTARKFCYKTARKDRIKNQQEISAYEKSRLSRIDDVIHD